MDVIISVLLNGMLKKNCSTLVRKTMENLPHSTFMLKKTCILDHIYCKLERNDCIIANLKWISAFGNTIFPLYLRWASIWAFSSFLESFATPPQVILLLRTVGKIRKKKEREKIVERKAFTQSSCLLVLIHWEPARLSPLHLLSAPNREAG